MTQAIDDLPAMLSEAKSAGDLVRPEKLLEDLSQATNALAVISDPASGEPLFAALTEEFGFFPTGHIGDQPILQDRREKWTGLFRWLFAELLSWSVANDPHARKLGAIFIVAQSVRDGHTIWTSMPPHIGENRELLDFLQVVVKSAAQEFGVRGGGVEPIWEREAVERFKIADAAGDWVEIGQSLRLFEQQLFRVGAAFRQTVRLLLQCSLNQLVLATSSIRQSLVAMQLANSIPRNAGLALAALSENPYVQFACVYHAVSRQVDSRPLSFEERADLSATLLKVGRDSARWIAWMTVFNAYPMRYPMLQAALGETLATVTESALQSYVNAVYLHPWPAAGAFGQGRQAIAECLRAFRVAAPTERRLLLWRQAYERWSHWSFGQDDPNQHLFAVNRSDLDYAIVAFASECLNEAQRTEELHAIRTALQNLAHLIHRAVEGRLAGIS